MSASSANIVPPKPRRARRTKWCQDCQVRIEVGKEKRVIKQKDLYGVAFAMTNDDDMRDNLMPVRKEVMMRFKKVHQVQLKSDMKAGETLQFTSVIDVPTYVVEGMRDLVASEVPEAVYVPL